MRSIDMLLEDHAEIRRLLIMLSRAVKAQREGETVDPRVFQDAAEFLHGYADRYHHVREEEHVFPVLQSYMLLTMAGQLDCMPGEHEMGRELTAAMKASSARYAEGDATGATDFADAANKYFSLLDHHMGVEEGILFELADRVVSDEHDASMAEGLEIAAKQYRESGDATRYQELLESLKAYEPSEAETT